MLHHDDLKPELSELYDGTNTALELIGIALRVLERDKGVSYSTLWAVTEQLRTQLSRAERILQENGNL